MFSLIKPAVATRNKCENAKLFYDYNLDDKIQLLTNIKLKI